MMTTTRAGNPIFETADDAIVAMDRAGTIIEFNPAAERLFGHARQDVLGRLVSDAIIPIRLRPTHGASLERYLATREAHLVGRRVELSALRRDGTTFPAEFAITSTGSGDAQTFSGIIRDISERKESEHFRLLVAAVNDHAIFMLDSQGYIATWNAGAEAVKGYSQAEIIGQHFSVFYSAEDRTQGKPDRELEIAEKEGRFEERGWRLRKDGSEFWANVLISAMRDGAGKLVGFAIVTRNLTEQRKAERLEELEARRKAEELGDENRRMQEQNRLKSEFLANMSHELRTPLNAIIGFADLIFKGKVGPVSAEHKEYLGDILDSSHHLLKLINDVLDLAKVESGKVLLRPVRVDLGELIAEVADTLRGLASSKRIRVTTTVDVASASVVLDPSKLKQVLYNYLSNALKFTPDAGLITIHVLPSEGDCIRIEVRDTGIGISAEDVGRLFLEFQQLDAGMAKKYAGTGLGLALTKRIVEAQGGSVGVTSEPGKGSMFWAVLPREADSSSIDAMGVAEAIPTPPALERTILVVDDDPAALRVMQATLGTNGYTAVCFADPAEALRATETTTPTLVVLDVLMPDPEGFAVLERLRAVPRMRDIPIVVWTRKDMSEAERREMLLGTQRVVLRGQDESAVILDALSPYLGTHAGGGGANGR